MTLINYSTPSLPLELEILNEQGTNFPPGGTLKTLGIFQRVAVQTFHSMTYLTTRSWKAVVNLKWYRKMFFVDNMLS